MDVARGIPRPAWPLPTVEPKLVATYGGKSFGAARAPKAGVRPRQHAGVDILAPRGAPVVAMEGGTIVAHQRFNGPLAHALLLQTDSGIVLLYGEVEPESWSELGVDIGSRVERGDAIARVGQNPGGSTMLHFETYRRGTSQNHRWYADGYPPPELLDPTVYLETAAAGEQVSPVESDEHDDHDEQNGDGMPELDDGLQAGQFEVDEAGGHVWNWSARDNGWTDEQLRQYWGHDPDYGPPYSVQRPDDTIPACRQAGGVFVEPNLCRLPDGTLCRALDVMRGDCATDVVPDVGPDVEPGGDGIWPDIFPPGDGGLGIPWWLVAIAAVVLVEALD